MQLSPLWLAGVLALSTNAQNAPEQLCGRDILTTGDAWENVQVERYEFEQILASDSLVRWPQRVAALVSHLRFMERRALLPQEQRGKIAIGVQLVAGRILPSNQCALDGDAEGLRGRVITNRGGHGSGRTAISPSATQAADPADSSACVYSTTAACYLRLRNTRPNHATRTPQPETMNPEPPPAPQDDGLDWLREIRRNITAESDHDPLRLGDKLREMEKLP